MVLRVGVHAHHVFVILLLSVVDLRLPLGGVQIAAQNILTFIHWSFLFGSSVHDMDLTLLHKQALVFKIFELDYLDVCFRFFILFDFFGGMLV